VDIERIKVYDKVNGPIVIGISDFAMNNQKIHILSQVNIICTGPNP